MPRRRARNKSRPYERIGVSVRSSYVFGGFKTRRIAKVDARELTGKAKERLCWMRVYAATGSADVVAASFGIARSTFYKWLGRYKNEGPYGLCDQSHRPRKVRTPKTPKETLNAIVALRKKYPSWSKYKVPVKI